MRREHRSRVDRIRRRACACASEELADEIRRALPRSIEVLCAPTPEVDEIRESMADFFEGCGPDASATCLVPGVDRSTLDEFFRTSDRLFRAAPWKLSSDDPVYVTIEARGITRAVISIIGNAGQELGFLRFGSLDDYDAFIEAAEAFQADERPVIPAHVALNFYAPRSASHRDEVARHGWPIAKAYPSILAVETSAWRSRSSWADSTLGSTWGRSRASMRG